MRARLALAGGLLALLAALVGLPRVEVAGDSMQPVLAPGDRLVVLPFGVRPGRMVVLADPAVPSRTLVKRLAAVTPSGALDVRGDNATASTDSRHHGPVDPRSVRGRPLYRYAPEARAGWMWWA